MARTHVQQSQISGSLVADIDSAYVAGSALELAANRTLVSDLNDLRKQVNRIIGVGAWTDKLNGEQDLADIWAAMQASGTGADFMGAISTVGSASIGGNITGSLGLKLTNEADVGGTLYVGGVATFNSAMTGSAGLQLAGDLDVNSSMDVSGQVDLAAAGVATNVRGTLDVVENATFSSITGSAGLKIDGDADFNSSADFFGAVNMQSTLSVTDIATFSAAMTGSAGLELTGDAHLLNNLVVDGTAKVNNSVDPSGHLYFVGASNEISASSLYSSTGSDLLVPAELVVSGAAGFDAGIVITNGGLSVAGDSMEVTGSFGVDGPATVRSLSVTGSAGISISGDVAKHLYIVGDDGTIKDEDLMWFDGTKLYVSGSAELQSNLEVKGGVITLSNGASIDSAAVAGELKLDESLVIVTGDLKVAGNGISGSSGANIVLESSGDVKIVGDLQVFGDDIKSSTGATVVTLSGADALFKANVQVDGDLRVKGATTYIDTQNMRVEDAFIYLATGSLGTTDSGIVLHGGAGAGMDLVIGQDGGAGEVIFGKGNRAPDGDGAMDGIELVPAWMSEVKFGLNEGALSGSLAVDGLNMELSAAADLNLSANGNSVGLMSGAEYTTFDTNFTATSIVGALNELYAAGAGGNKKGNLSIANVTPEIDGPGTDSSLSFSSVGTLGTASQQFIDVYLNGVLLAYGSDVKSVTSTTIKIDAGIALNNDDVITVVLRGAA